MRRSIRKTRATDSVLGSGVLGVLVGGGVGVLVGGVLGVLVGGGVGVLVGVLVGIGNVALVGVVVNLLSLVGDVVGRRREGHASTGRCAVSAPASLRWVRGVLPGDEGAAWLAEVNSCLAEAADPDERRRYVCSYRRAAPQLLWTSWSEYLNASGRRELL